MHKLRNDFLSGQKGLLSEHREHGIYCSLMRRFFWLLKFLNLSFDSAWRFLMMQFAMPFLDCSFFGGPNSRLSRRIKIHWIYSAAWFCFRHTKPLSRPFSNAQRCRLIMINDFSVPRALIALLRKRNWLIYDLHFVRKEKRINLINDCFVAQHSREALLESWSLQSQISCWLLANSPW